MIGKLLSVTNRKGLAATATAAVALFSTLASSAPGDLDLAFNATGSFGPFSFTTGLTYPRAMALQPDGRLVVAGYCEKSATVADTDFCALRLNRDGTLDASFTGPSGTSAGFFTVPLGSAMERLAAVRLQSDGKIVLAGTCGSSGVTGAFCLARLNANGSLDVTFGGGNGYLELSFGSGPLGDNLVDMAIQADDKIVVAGTCRLATVGQFCVARLNASTGSFDASFDGPNAAGTGVGTGNGRFVQTIASASTNELLGALSIQADGAIVLGGSCNVELCMMRLVGSNGSFDATFDGPGAPAGNGRWVRDLTSCTSYCQVRGVIEVFADGTTTPHLLVAIYNSAPGSPAYEIALLNALGALSSRLTGRTAFDGGSTRSVMPYPFFEVTRVIERATSRLALGSGDGQPSVARFTPGFSPGWGIERSHVLPLHVGSGTVYATLQQPDGRVLALGATAGGLVVTRVDGGPYACGGDYDGDGSVLATTDSLIGTRLALGVNSAAVIAGINFPVGATRTTWPAIRDFVIQNCGVPLTQ
ncbi:MAG TPA: delta-60 repeat domain-containing protein [Casimicrobium sp.]|nr:delta-60 repeat domain-containing protein [Casimicrobium sp.]